MARTRFVCLALVLVTLLVYLPTQHYEFLSYDDPNYVSDNAVVQDGLTAHGIGWAFSGPHADNWHPVTWLSHMLDCQLFGLDPGAPHLVNAMLHAANAALVFLLLLRLTGAFWPAAFAAALFAWHPLRVESVAWIAERKDVLSAFFGLLTLLAYLRYVRERRRTTLWLAVGLYALAVMSKPMLVTLPFLLLLLDYWPLQRLKSSDAKSSTAGHLLLEKWPFLLFSAISCAFTVQAQSTQAIVPLNLLPLNYRVANALTAYLEYLGKMIWPANLAVFYPQNLQPSPLTILLPAAALLLITGLAWRARHTQPWLIVGWLWFLGTLVPVIGLVQVGSQAMADRYTYLPMLGVLLALAGTLQYFNVGRRFGTTPLAVVAVLILGGCLAVTSRQLTYWHDNITLFTHALAVTKDNALAHINLGVALDLKGDKADKQAAITNYHEAIRIAPYTGMAHNNLAGVLSDLGQNEEAESEYHKALDLRPKAGLTHCNLGELLAKEGRYDEAMQEYAIAAELRPWDPFPYYLMGKARMRQGRSAEAIIHFHKALRLYPNHLKSLVYLARLLATDPDPQVRNAAEAIVMAERANDLTGGQQAFVLDTLAAAYAEGGRFPEAQQVVQLAAAAAGKAGESESVAELQKRVALYEASQPYRESATNISVEPEHSSETAK